MLALLASAFLLPCLEPKSEASANAAATAIAQPVPHTTRVLFANRTAYRRAEWATATVPFPQSAWDGVAPYTAQGCYSELVPFGARWPDGSVRYAQLAVYLDLLPGEERMVTVAPGVPDPGAFVTSQWIAAALQQLDLRVLVKVAGQNATPVTFRLERVERVSPVRQAWWLQGRAAGTSLVCDLWLTQWSDQDSVSFELRVTSSDTDSQDWYVDYEFVDLVASGLMPFVRGANRRGVNYLTLSPVGPSHLRLLENERLYDGQGHEWYGDLVAIHPQAAMPPDWPLRVDTLLATVQQPLYGCCQDWAASGAFGPFGVVTPPPAWLADGGRALAIQRGREHFAYTLGAGAAWDNLPLGLLAHAGTSGDQADFGVAKMVEIVASGMPDGIDEARFSCSEEANRPVHHREADGRRVLVANHPHWVVVGGRTHFNRVVSPDRLGKPWPEPHMNYNGWTPKDHQHWSSLTLASAYMLTGSYSLREELLNDAENYIASHTIPSERPNWSTNSIDQPRAVGRTFLTLAWNYLLTGREDLRARLGARARECVNPQCIGLQLRSPVHPISISGPDARIIPLYEFWKPWEEALAVVGLEACYRVTGELAAREVAALAAHNLAYHGWRVTATECVIASGIKWNADGSPLAAAELDDPTKVVWGYNTGYALWALPAMRLSRHYADLLQDAGWAVRAQTIVDRLITRAPPQNGGWDRYADWWPVLP